MFFIVEWVNLIEWKKTKEAELYYTSISGCFENHNITFNPIADANGLFTALGSGPNPDMMFYETEFTKEQMMQLLLEKLVWNPKEFKISEEKFPLCRRKKSK